MLHCIITTIQRPTASMRKLAALIAGQPTKLIVAGDTKGPDSFDLSDVENFATEQLEFLTIDDQLSSGFELARLLPTKHYSRKNIGYLQAIRAGANCIYETDDDNAPLPSWRPRNEFVAPTPCLESNSDKGPKWVNVYRHFSDEKIWPRGLPLDQIDRQFGASSFRQPLNSNGMVHAPIQQGLADGSPDVDAIWRLVLDREFCFKQAPSVMLPPGNWCPFNTQTTWWWPVVYPLLYIPSYCSFRMCDIWKSFVAQRCLWELGTGIVFHASEVWQDRNPHDLMRDFNDEIPGYLENHRLAQILESTELNPGRESIGMNLRKCYELLINAKLFPEQEMRLVDAWLAHF